jgi:hypothetical protein
VAVVLLAAGIALWAQISHLVRHPEVASRYASGRASSFEQWPGDRRAAYVRGQRILSIGIIGGGLVLLGVAMFRG